MRHAIRRLLLLCSLVWAALAAAHPMPESRVWIDTRADGLQLTLQLPLNRLEFAFGQPLAEHPTTVLARHGDALARYLLLHVGARSGDAGWQVLRPELRVTGGDGATELEATLRLVAPVGADTRTPTLLLDVITHEVRTHRIQVFLRNDWAAGVVGAQPMGMLDTAHTTLQLALGKLRPGAAFGALLRQGALHIAEGADHLLFLMLLLLVAPRVARGRRWAEARPAAGALSRVAWLVSAFTLGHSLTLALGSTDLMRLPAQAVEVTVAVTIAVTAWHAWRPLFCAAETWMAFAFGLVHGFAFSASLDGAGLTKVQHAGALLAFNLGIETMQLALVAAVLPPLVLVALRRPRWFAVLQRIVAVGALVAAVVWIAERLGAPWPELLPNLQPPSRAAPLLTIPWLLAAAAWLCSRDHQQAFRSTRDEAV